MASGRLWILALTAACSFTAGKLPGADRDAAPMGDVSDGPPGDRDADGVLDEDDLCPDLPDPLQLDHDHDGHGDACDGCPHLASVLDPDGDGDGVGDACDPRPTVGTDHRALWLGFDASDATALGTWVTTGTWTLSQGWLVHDYVNGTLHEYRTPTTLTFAKAHVETSMRLDAFTDNGAAAGVIQGYRPRTSTSTPLEQFYQCALFQNASTIGARTQADFGNQLDDQMTAWPGAKTNGTVLGIIATYSSTFNCTYSPPETTVKSTLATTSGQFEFVAQDAGVSFDYLFIVEIGS